MPKSPPSTAMRLSSMLAPRLVRYSVSSATRPGRSGPIALSTRNNSVVMAGILLRCRRGGSRLGSPSSSSLSSLPGRRARGLELGVDEAQHLVAVRSDVELVPEDGLDRPGGRSLGCDHVRDAVGDADQRPQHVVRTADGAFAVGDDGERSAELAGEAALGVEVVGADADERRPRELELDVG